MAVVVTDNLLGIPHSTAILGTALDQLMITRTMCRMIYGQERCFNKQGRRSVTGCFPRTSGRIYTGGHY
jgi:hypothetical protein